MRNVLEIVGTRTAFGYCFGIIIGTIASIYIAKIGIQYVSKKCTHEGRKSLDRSNTSTVTYAPTETSDSGSTEIKADHEVCCESFQEPCAASNKCTSCSICGSNICKNQSDCSIFSEKSNTWKCSCCYQFDKDQDAHDWSQHRADGINAATSEVSTEQKRTTNSESNVMLELNGETSPIPLKQRIHVRRIIEDLIASMVGGSLDDVLVGQIFKNLEYLSITEHGQNPSSSYQNLLKIVQTIAQEVIKLPEFQNQRGFSNIDATQIQASFEPKVYEDLLATAVINKIVETYNDKKYENGSGIHSAGSDLDSNFNTERINNNFILNERSSSTDFKYECSALNERIRSTSMKTSDIIDEIFREKLGKGDYNSSTSSSSSIRSGLSDDYIQNHKTPLPDSKFRKSFCIGVADLDDIEPDLQTNHSDISDNWHFRKPLGNHRLNGSTSSLVSTTVPVGMLVPSPTEDCKTLIGDRNADEISDLSEAGSDSDSVTFDNDIFGDPIFGDNEADICQSTKSTYDLPHVLAESKISIGGKKEMSSFEKIKGSLVELLEPDSLVSVQSLNGQSPAISEAKNEFILIDDRINYQNDCLTHKVDSSTNTELKMGEFIGLDSNRSLNNFDSLESEYINNKNDMEIMQNSWNNKPIPAVRKLDENKHRFADETVDNIRTVFSLSKTFASKGERFLHKCTTNSNGEFNDSSGLHAPTQHPNLKFDYSKNNGCESLSHMELVDSLENNKCNKNGNSTHELEAPINIKHDCTVETTQIDETNAFNDDGITSNIIENEHKLIDLPGSIAEREHMKWKNAVELPNNPYSAEALQRRLSQTHSQLIDIEDFTGINSAETVDDDTLVRIIQSNPPSDDIKSMKIMLGPRKLNSERYGRDYYINDSKTASGSREQRTSGDLNLHRAIDDDDDHLEPDDDDSFVIGNFEVVSDTNPIDTTRTLHKKQPIQVDVNEPILNKAKKLDHLCAGDRKYYLLNSEAVTVDEYTKLSLSSETTDDSQVPSLSLYHGDDSLLTTVSDESECATAVHIYDLSKRETKILRHDIIKRSRSPIGGDFKNRIDSLGNCCDSANDQSFEGCNTTVFAATIKQRSSRIPETNKADEIASTRSTRQLKSVRLNQNPRKLKMDDLQLMNDAPGTRFDPKNCDELLQLKENHEQMQAQNIDIDTITATRMIIESERNASYVERHCDDQQTNEYVKNDDEWPYEADIAEQFEQPNDNEHSRSNKESSDECASSNNPGIDENIEVSDTSGLSDEKSCRNPHTEPTEEIQPFKHVQDYERNSEVMVQVSEHREKTVIEEDVISHLPSVKALAQTFSQHVNNDESKQLQRPKVTWRQSFNGNNERGIGIGENDGINDSSPDSFVPRFNNAYHPIAPGYSITARSLSTKFREELRNSTGEKTGRSTPERPSSPVLVPGILKNNVAFFEKLRDQ